MKVFYVRHGETTWSLSGQHTGTTEVPLTEQGEASVVALRTYLDGIEFSHVVCSPRLRARRTCELLGLIDRAEIRDDVAEWNYGDYEGLRTVDIRKQRPGWDIWTNGCPGGESPAQMSARVDGVVASLETLDGNVALVSHGHFGGALLARWAGLAIAEGRHLVVDPASISVLGHAKREPEIRAVMLVNASAEKLSSRF
jgi:broad specificity phosphatase PhoE